MKSQVVAGRLREVVLRCGTPLMSSLQPGSSLVLAGRVVQHGLVVGEGVEDRLVLAAVARADRMRVEAAEHVELGDDERGERVDARGVLQRDEVEPAGAPRRGRSWCRTRRRAARISSPISSCELGRERARRRRASRRPWRCPRPRRCRAGRRRRRRTPRPRPGSTTSRTDTCRGRCRAARPGRPRRATMRSSSSARWASDAVSAMCCSRRWPKVRYSSVIVCRSSARVARERAQRQPLGLERGDDLLLEDLLVEHVLHADPQARRLVGVARARCRACVVPISSLPSFASPAWSSIRW